MYIYCNTIPIIFKAYVIGDSVSTSSKYMSDGPYKLRRRCWNKSRNCSSGSHNSTGISQVKSESFRFIIGQGQCIPPPIKIAVSGWLTWLVSCDIVAACAGIAKATELTSAAASP